MAKRFGFGISAKMILNSTLLVVLAVAGFGIMSVLTIEDAYETNARQAIERSREAMAQNGKAAVERIKAESREQINSAKRSAMLRTVALGGVFALIGTVLAIFQGLSITRSLGELAWKADRIARGDFQARVKVLSRDEIGVLAHKFNAMAEGLASLRTRARDKAAEKQALDVARTIQETLVPANEPVDCGLVNIAGFFQPAAPYGGDWWTYQMLHDQKLVLVIGHGSGRGVPAALLTATAKAACDAACMAHNDDLAVTRLVEIMNNAIYQSARRRLVTTCFASIIDLQSRVITYANAGHDFPYLYRLAEDGGGEFGSLMIRGNRLGDLKESHYESTSTQLRPGDTLIWYTQGIVQCENEHGEAYGEKRFRASIRRAAHLGAGDMRNTMVSEAMSFYGDTPRKDDMTLIVGRVT